MTLWIVAVLVALAAVYVVVGRAVLKSMPWAKPFFDWVEPIEIALWKKSETILAARLLQWGAGLVTVYDAVATFAAPLLGLDWTPVTGRLLAGVPPDLRPLVISGGIAAIGGLFEWLRRTTTKPLELVAVPEAKPMPLEVEIALARADAVKHDAVAAVEAAKAEGKA